MPHVEVVAHGNYDSRWGGQEVERGSIFGTGVKRSTKTIAIKGVRNM